MQIVSGIMKKPLKCVLYGPEGIGKSSFAAMAPRPVFIDTEGSTTRMDVARMQPNPSSLTMLNTYISYVIQDPSLCKTLVIDSGDWAQKLMVDAICAKNGKAGIEDFGYGKGYSYVYEEFGRMLNLLDQVTDRGINVIITAHAAMRKFEQPDEMGAYDRWELKLINSQKCNVAAMLKEWADLVLFANYETIVVKTEDKKSKAQGGRRVMYTTHHPCWDAKNRFGLPEKLPLDYNAVAQCFLYDEAPAYQPEPQPISEPYPTTAPAYPATEPVAPQSQPPVQEPAPEPIPPMEESGSAVQMSSQNFHSEPTVPSGLPQPLVDLMQQNQVTEAQIQAVVAQRGYYPANTPIANYDPNFIAGVLVGAWDQVYQMIKESK